MSEKNRKRGINRKTSPVLTWGSPLRSPAAAGRPSQEVAQPTWPPLLCRLPSRQGNGVWPARARATAPRLLPPCLPVLPSPLWMDRTSPRSRPGPFPLPLALPPPWFSLPRAHPSAAAAIARRCRGHRPPLASLTRFPAPPRPPLPPRQATHLRTRSIADAVVFFTTDAGDRLRRHHRQFVGRRTSPSTPACSASPP